MKNVTGIKAIQLDLGIGDACALIRLNSLRIFVRMAINVIAATRTMG
jgi:hypothetical protein